MDRIAAGRERYGMETKVRVLRRRGLLQIWELQKREGRREQHSNGLIRLEDTRGAQPHVQPTLEPSDLLLFS